MKKLENREILYDFPFFRLDDTYAFFVTLPNMTKYYYLEQGRRVAGMLFMEGNRGNIMNIE